MSRGIIAINIISTILATIVSGFLLNRIEERYRAKRDGHTASQKLASVEHFKNYSFAVGYGLSFLLVLIFIEVRWPLSNLAAFLLVVVFSSIVLSLFFAKESLLNQPEEQKQGKKKSRLLQRTLKKPVVLEAGTLIFLLFAIFFLDRFLPHNISMNAPDTVNDTTLISGRVIDESWAVYVLIRPIDSSGTFVVKATGPDSDKNWSAICYFGGGSGKQFYIRAVAISNDNLKQISNSPDAEKIEKYTSVQSRMYLVAKK